MPALHAILSLIFTLCLTEILFLMHEFVSDKVELILTTIY